jgi:hypothetical protein
MKRAKNKPGPESWTLFNVEIQVVKFSYFYTRNLEREVAPCGACVLMDVKDAVPLSEPDSDDVQRVYS